MDETPKEPDKEPDAAAEAKPPTLPAILASFLRLGSSSFGGGTVGWTYREIVERRGWMSEEKFLQTVTIAQVLPGANPVNLAVYVGLQLRGLAGAALAAFGMIAMPFCIILLLSFTYQALSGYPQTRTVLGGLACVGIASLLMAGGKSARQLKKRYFPIAVAAVIFVLVGIVRLPMIPVVLVALPVSVGFAYWLEGDKTNG